MGLERLKAFPRHGEERSEHCLLYGSQEECNMLLEGNGSATVNRQGFELMRLSGLIDTHETVPTLLRWPGDLFNYRAATKMDHGY